MTFILKNTVATNYKRSRQVFYRLVRMGAGHRPATTDKIGPTLFDERRLPLVAAIIGPEPNASIVIYDSNISGVIRYFTQIGWKPLVQQGEKAQHPWTGSKMAVPIKMHTLWVLMEFAITGPVKKHQVN